MPDKESGDELLRRARELGARAGELERQQQYESDGPWLRLQRRYGWLNRLDDQTRAVGKVLRPIIAVLGTLLGWVAAWFRWAAYRPASSSAGEAQFSIKRLGISCVLTLAAVAALHALVSALYYYTTRFDETVYVTGKQEIETGELYQFGGCTSLPCSTETDNGKFYLIESSLYFPSLFYPEENVFANIPQQDAACHVAGYGIYFRSLRWLYKSAQLYQHVTDVSCRPYTEEEIRRAVELGAIVETE
jgi:hypothetical protein